MAIDLARPLRNVELERRVLAEGVERLSAPNPEAGEDLRLHPTPIGDLEGLLDGGEIVQALHAAPLARFLLSRRAR